MPFDTRKPIALPPHFTYEVLHFQFIHFQEFFLTKQSTSFGECTVEETENEEKNTSFIFQ